MKRTFFAITLLACTAVAQSSEYPTPLATEAVGKTLTLPKAYPKEWLFLHDANFFSIIDGKIVLLDLTDTTNPYKGMIGAGQMATMLQATESPELYVSETFYSRRTRGERTDTITIYDAGTLAYKDEIVLPGGKRGQFVTQKHSFQFTDGERMGLVFNFTPAASVTVVDLPKRKVLNEIPLPGCSLIYPTGERGFSSLCANGTMMTFKLDAQGKVAESSSTEAFNTIDEDPLFMKTAEIDGLTYFVSFKGRVQAVDLRGEKAKPVDSWSLVSGADLEENWRPGGWQVLSGHAGKKLYVLMQKDGHEGSHKNGGTEVWVFDTAKKKRLQRIELATHGISIEVTQGKKPYLAVVNANWELDVYDLKSAKVLQTIGDRVGETPFAMHASR